MISDGDRLLTPHEVSSMLGIKAATLKDWRYHGRGPAYTRLSKKTVRYWLSAVTNFMKSLG